MGILPTPLLKCLNTVFVALIMSMGVMGCSFADERIAYYESKRELARYSITSHDEFPLRLVIFVQLRDGSLHLPKLYFYKSEKAPSGVRKIETEGSLSCAASKQVPSIWLPVAKDVDKYILLVRTTFPVDSEKDGQAVEVWKFTDWSFIEVLASDVKAGTPISMPSVKELSKRTEDQDKLHRKLIETYDAVQKEIEKRMKATNP